MSGLIVVMLMAGVPALAVLIVYAAGRDLARREERFQQSLTVYQARRGTAAVTRGATETARVEA
jgi:type II secretory pathway pseudopilin PulG